jgi:hypothetical protein
VFERFYRILGNKAEGSGLGLAIVREIAQQHGAEVDIFNNPRATQPKLPGALFRLTSRCRPRRRRRRTTALWISPRPSPAPNTGSARAACPCSCCCCGW